MKRLDFGLFLAAVTSTIAGCGPPSRGAREGEAITVSTSPPVPTMGPFGRDFPKLKPLPVRAGNWKRSIGKLVPESNGVGDHVNNIVGNVDPTSALNTTPKLGLEGDAPYYGDFGSPIFFRLDDNGKIHASGADKTAEVDALLEASERTVNVSFHFTYINVQKNYFVAPAEKRGRTKQIIQFKPTISQQAPLADLTIQNQPLSWCALYTFTPSDSLMYSGTLDPSQETTLRSIPVPHGEGWISTLYAGTALHEPKIPNAMSALIGKLNAFRKITNGTAGVGFSVPLSAAGQIAMQTAQSYVEQVASLLSNPKNELAFNGTPVNFVVTKEPQSATLDDTLRIQAKPDARYIIVAQKHADAFDAATKNRTCKISPKTHELQTEDGFSFENFNYIILQTQVRGAASSAEPSPKRST